MQVTIGTWRMREQCVPGSLSSSPAQEPGNEARLSYNKERTESCHPLEMTGNPCPNFQQRYSFIVV